MTLDVHVVTVGTSPVNLKAATAAELDYSENMIFYAPAENGSDIYIGDQNVSTSFYAVRLSTGDPWMVPRGALGAFWVLAESPNQKLHVTLLR